MQPLPVYLDDPAAAELALMAERLGTDSGAVARVLLTQAIAAARDLEDLRQRQTPAGWDEFQQGLQSETVPVDNYVDAV